MLDESAMYNYGSRYRPNTTFLPFQPVDLAVVKSDFVRMFPLEIGGIDVASNPDFNVA